MANPYVNKVIVNDQIKLDLTGDTVTAETLMQGYTAHDASGAPIVGTASGGGDGDIDALIEREISGAYTNENVSKVGTCVFMLCSSLITISFPSCGYIGTSAFQSCSSLNAISFPICSDIESYAFYGCKRLTSVSFPSCTTIGGSAFGYCENLQAVNFPMLRSTIHTNCFTNCIALTSVSFPLFSSIPGSFFNSCYSLSVASFPSCRVIMPYAFVRCYNLLSLYLLSSSVPKLSNKNAFSSTPISDYTTSTGGVYGSIIVQASMLDAFKAATNWSLYSNRFSVWNGVD